MPTCFDARTAILYLGSRAGTLTTDLIALNVCDSFRKSSSICTRGHLTGSKTKSLQQLTQVIESLIIVLFPYTHFLPASHPSKHYSSDAF